MSATRRRWVAAFAAMLLLFAQLSAAAHACLHAAAPLASGHCAEHAPPPDEDLGSALACKAHCEPGSPNPAVSPAVDVPSAAPLLAVLDWSPTTLHVADAAWRDGTPRSGAPPPGAAPVYLALLVLRN